MRILLSSVLGAVLALSACDAVRLPGDGRSVPEDPVIPDGAPGPAPPTVPVDNPYGEPDPDPDTPVTPPDPDAADPVDPVDADPADPVTPDPADGADDPSVPTDPDAPTDPDTPDPVGPADPDTPDPVEPEPQPLPVKFEYYPPGDLIPGSGIGSPDQTVYVPDMLFPIKDAPAYPQSQVWRFGGFMGGQGGQCDERNFTAPWRDNFCETRSRTRNTPLCPAEKVHQGQDIRVGTRADCLEMVAMRPDKPELHSVVAVEAGTITKIGNYWVTLRGNETGNLYNYIHLNMGALKVAEDELVTKGQELGYASNDFGGTATTFHLHFEIKSPLEGEGFTHVPPYMSLVAAYERRENGRGQMIENDTVEVASVAVLPEGVEIIE
ncbi:MAG: peptidoglycan DD-metalloendopeptidase family protein [Henriciella sp.]|nr:peptidoglycan DD-metalloendopeptidase family protein [Henriciella sp.]